MLPRNDLRTSRPRQARRVSSVSAVLFLASCGLVACGPTPLDAVMLAPTSLSSELAAHWTFDETSGTAVHDSSGNRREGTLMGGTWITAGKFDGAVHLASGDYITVPNFPDAASATISVWVRLDAADLAADLSFETATLISTEVVDKGGWEMNVSASSQHLHFAYWVRPNEPQYAFFDDYTWQPAEWSHFVGVVDGAEKKMTVYLNGMLRKEIDVPRGISPGSTTLYFGKWSGEVYGARPLAGAIDDVAIYRRALNPLEIEELEQHPAPVLAPVLP